MKSKTNIYVGEEAIAESKQKLKTEREIKPAKPAKKKNSKHKNKKP